ncbi:transposase [Shewanella sedimentimangrovi]|uniref:Transposase n=1 Tax=Shewanella sedimentimangrovi TaxID=2814293 RepID=A0ABX7R0C1_9GAMM|nr:transposase [Shewanella sedimentimangrovi]QSX37216.1 transposase [Shewanella sedimentimangrovi]
MPRKPRLYLPDIPYHICQRGNNRTACFFSSSDFGIYINALTDALQTFHVQLHAFVLMTNHVHLLMTPSDSQGISKVMQSVGRTYVRAINGLYRRTGTLWEGRHKSSPINSEEYLLICQRYIELNPVRAGMVDHPSEYRWSSYQSNGAGKAIRCLTPHPTYLSLGNTHTERQHAYRELFNCDISSEQLHILRDCLNHNYPMGNERFKSDIEAALNRKLGHLKPGRPWSGKNE